jgi:hypothetical protein
MGSRAGALPSGKIPRSSIGIFLILDDDTVDRILNAPQIAQRNWREFHITAVQVNFPGNSQWITEERLANEAQEADDDSNDDGEYYDEDAALEDDANRWPGQVEVGIYDLISFWQYLVPERM